MLTSCLSICGRAWIPDLYNAVGNRTDRLASWLVVMSLAFGASVRVDLVDLGAHSDRLVGTLGITHIAVDALFSNEQCHNDYLPLSEP